MQIQNSLLSNINNGDNKDKNKMFKNMLGNIPGGESFWVGGQRGSWYPFHFVYKALRLFIFIPKTLSFHCKYKVILGCSVSRSLLYSVSFFKYLPLKSRFHLLFGSSFKKLLWENNHLEVLCRIIVIPFMGYIFEKDF